MPQVRVQPEAPPRIRVQQPVGAEEMRRRLVARALADATEWTERYRELGRVVQLAPIFEAIQTANDDGAPFEGTKGARV